MAIELRWVGEADLDRVAETRLRCYAKSTSELESFKLRTRNDPRSKSGDYLLAETGGQAVGTATSLSMRMWVRGSCLPCQGVAWVGAIKTMRRKAVAGASGVATTVMREVIRLGRERGDVVSALMPFRASYYEHFGYGVVERRCEWSVPISTLPTGDFDSIRYAEPSDSAARRDCLQRVNQSGQCEVERPPDYWAKVDETAADGFTLIDRIEQGPVRSSMTFLHQQTNGKDLVKVTDCFYQDTDALKRQLYFLSSLKDQFADVSLTLPADVPLNRLLKESQLPHRPVNHAVASCHPFTRMQVRVLDHKKFLEALQLPGSDKSQVVIGVSECEGHVSKFKLQIEGGRIQCSLTDASANFQCTDRTWAAVVTGDLKATDAVRFGLATGDDAAKLDVLSRGPAPFTHEHF